MDFKQFLVLVKGMKGIYPSERFLPDDVAIKLWYKLLQDIPYEVLNVAIQKYAMTNKFPPTVADLRELSTTIVQGEPKDWGSGWEDVVMAIRKYGYYQESKAMETFDDITKQVVKRLGWNQLCMSETPMNDRANFRMIYEQIAERKKNDRMIPIGLQTQIASLLEDKKEPSNGILTIGGE